MPARRPPTWTPTPRQILVLHTYVREGAGKGTAHALEIAEDTVRGTLEAMRKRAGVETTAQLVYLGAACGWLTIPELDRRCRRALPKARRYTPKRPLSRTT